MNLMQVTTHIVFFTFLMRDDLPKRQKQIIQRDHFKSILTPPILLFRLKFLRKILVGKKNVKF